MVDGSRVEDKFLELCFEEEEEVICLLLNAFFFNQSSLFILFLIFFKSKRARLFIEHETLFGKQI